jgi:hypothetical protein
MCEQYEWFIITWGAIGLVAYGAAFFLLQKVNHLNKNTRDNIDRCNQLLLRIKNPIDANQSTWPS